MSTLKTGSLAYFDALSGLVPVVVTRITGKTGPASIAQCVEFTVRSDHGPYRRGERLKSSGLYVFPASAIRHRRHDTGILPYSVEVD